MKTLKVRQPNLRAYKPEAIPSRDIPGAQTVGMRTNVLSCSIQENTMVGLRAAEKAQTHAKRP